ncbi:hypothetical protein D3C81_353580 [compost metagenome]
MIRVYPSRLPGEPLETHSHGATTVAEWLQANVAGYASAGVQPIEVDVDGIAVPINMWAQMHIEADSDVRIYPSPRGYEIAAWAVVAIAAAFAAYAYFSMRGMETNNRQGTGISLNPARANTAKLGSPIREILGRCRVYPDYLVQPVSRFVDGSRYQSSMFMCVGRGEHILPLGGMRIGATPMGSFGDDVSVAVYPPGANVAGDPRSENWFNSSEVGGTTSGTSGLDLSETADVETSISADSITVAGNVVSLNNATVTDDDGDERPATSVPPDWREGSVLTIRAAAVFAVSDGGLYSLIAGPAIDELTPFVGMPVLLTYNEADYSLFVASHSAGVPAVPGIGGSPASVSGSAPVGTFDFSSTPAVFGLGWQDSSYPVTLNANYITASVLSAAINDQLLGSNLAATLAGGVLSIGEVGSPYAGGAISHVDLPEALFGAAPVATAGTATVGGTSAQQPSVTLAYDSAIGTAFGGLPIGAVSMALARGQSEYRISAISGLTVVVQRMTETGVPDTGWPGWVQRTAMEYSMTGLQENERWLGPFLVCPDGETTTAFEYDFNFSSGLIRYTSKGKRRRQAVTVRVGWRVAGSGSPWTVRSHTYNEMTEDGRGYSERVNVAVPAQIEVRVRRVTARGGSSSRDAVYWQGLRARLTQRATAYEGLTTIGLTVTTGTKLAAQSDRRFNVLATRQYAGGTPRTISGALYHVLESVGFAADEVDRASIDHLEATYWTPRGEFLDYSAERDNTSVLDVLNLCTQAGMSYFLLSEGMVSAGREGIKSWTGAITPQRMVTPLITAFMAHSDDDYDGVDVTYTDEVTWAAETVECRLPGADTARKVEAFNLEGVGARQRAYRMGMRRLMKHQGQRLTHTCSTELMALAYQYGDRVKLTDDIPGTSTTSCVIDDAWLDGDSVVIMVGEWLDWNLPAPRCLIRFQDGTASGVLVPTRIDDHSLRIPAADLPAEQAFGTWVMGDPNIEPPELIFCDSLRVGYDALISEIAPGQGGSVDVTALQYDPAFYQYDDASAP